MCVHHRCSVQSESSSQPCCKAAWLTRISLSACFPLSSSNLGPAFSNLLLLTSRQLFLAAFAPWLHSRSIRVKCHTSPDGVNKTSLLVWSVSGGNDKSLEIINNRVSRGDSVVVLLLTVMERNLYRLPSQCASHCFVVISLHWMSELVRWVFVFTAGRDAFEQTSAEHVAVRTTCCRTLRGFDALLQVVDEMLSNAAFWLLVKHKTDESVFGPHHPATLWHMIVGSEKSQR